MSRDKARHGMKILMNAAVGHMDGSALMVIGVSA